MTFHHLNTHEFSAYCTVYTVVALHKRNRITWPFPFSMNFPLSINIECKWKRREEVRRNELCESSEKNWINSNVVLVQSLNDLNVVCSHSTFFPVITIVYSLCLCLCVCACMCEWSNEHNSSSCQCVRDYIWKILHIEYISFLLRAHTQRA